MDKEYQSPIYQHKFGACFMRYAYACNGCGKPVEGYINAKVYGKVWCADCKRKRAEEWQSKKQAEHDDLVKEQVLDDLLQKFEEIDSCEFAMFSLCLIKEKINEMKGVNNE